VAVSREIFARQKFTSAFEKKSHPRVIGFLQMFWQGRKFEFASLSQKLRASANEQQLSALGIGGQVHLLFSKFKLQVAREGARHTCAIRKGLNEYRDDLDKGEPCQRRI
jgi:hypothetical protein